MSEAPAFWAEADLPASSLRTLNEYMKYQETLPPEHHRQSREQMADYFMRNYRAWLGFQAHNYCHGHGCQSCGCGPTGPCVSHTAGTTNTQDPRYKPAVMP